MRDKFKVAVFTALATAQPRRNVSLKNVSTKARRHRPPEVWKQLAEDLSPYAQVTTLTNTASRAEGVVVVGLVVEADVIPAAAFSALTQAKRISNGMTPGHCAEGFDAPVYDIILNTLTEYDNITAALEGDNG